MPKSIRQSLRALCWIALGCLALGCAHAGPSARRFQFPSDTLAFTNEVRWIYTADPQTGKQVHFRKSEAPAYSLRCFVMARMAREFFGHAQFAPDQPRVSDAEYRRLAQRVMLQSARTTSADARRIVIPGYADLRAFSMDQGAMLRETGGGAWRSYCQRGHWRMIFPFPRRHQEREAQRLATTLETGGAAVVHVVTFPQLTINHALVVFGAEARPDGIDFHAYDPNSPGEPLTVEFDARTGRFQMPATAYFIGGPVSVYEVFRGGLY
jgi:hypothetical protein